MSISGVTYTTDDSYVQVIWSPGLQRYILDFPFDKKLWGRVMNLDGAEWDEPIKKKFTFPKSSFPLVKEKLEHHIKWKEKEHIRQAVDLLKRDEETLQDVLERIPPSIDTSYLKVEPYDFQKLAVAWAATPKGRYSDIRGGLLADLMGLGKTLEGLAIAGYFKEQGWISNCLVICPATLKTQWGQEIEKFTHESYQIIKSGKGTKAIQGRRDLYKLIAEERPFYTIINYELLYQKEIVGKEPVGKPKDGKQKMKTVYGDYIDLRALQDLGYDMVIVDEAQRMKNPQTETARVIRELMPKHRLLMTGTPISKDLKNIFQLLDFIEPNILTDRNVSSFDERYQLFEDQFLVTGFNSFALPARIKEIKEEKNVDILRKKINPFILRRTTEDVSDEMPEKKEIITTVDWEPKQKKLYETIQAEMNDAQTKLAEAKDEEERTKWDNHQKLLMQLLLAVCDTPELLTMSDSNVVKRLLGKTKTFPRSQKIERLLEMIEEIVFENGGKLVIFTKFERMTQILAREINDLFAKRSKSSKQKPLQTFLYTGNVKQGCAWRDQLSEEKKDPSAAVCNGGCPLYDTCHTRTKAAWHFQHDPDTRVLLATDAANSGVNLQSGGYLINFDLPDSYDVYDQRNARIRRLGSTHSVVYIYNLVTKGGIDEAKYRKLMKQKQMIDHVVENDASQKLAIDQATQVLEELRQEMLQKKE